MVFCGIGSSGAPHFPNWTKETTGSAAGGAGAGSSPSLPFPCQTQTPPSALTRQVRFRLSASPVPLRCRPVLLPTRTGPELASGRCRGGAGSFPTPSDPSCLPRPSQDQPTRLSGNASEPSRPIPGETEGTNQKLPQSLPASCPLCILYILPLP